MKTQILIGSILLVLISCVPKGVPVIPAFSATPQTITPGQDVTLKFNTEGADQLTLNPGEIDVTSLNEYVVKPLTTTTYTLEAHGSSGSIKSSVTVTVQESLTSAPVIKSFASNLSSINPGQNVILSFSATGARRLVINPGNISVKGKTSLTVSPTATTTYTLTASNSAGSVSAVKAITVQSTAVSNLPFIDVTKIPAPAVGHKTERVYRVKPIWFTDYYLDPNSPNYHPDWVANWIPQPQDSGSFRTDCGFSHMGFDDPIVFPGQPGKSHLHTFFGNTGVNAYTTVKSLKSTGNSTCRGGIANRSAYWVPTMIDTINGRPVVPDHAGIYYKTGVYVVPSTIKKFPPGIRVLAGNSKAMSRKESQGGRFKCVGGPQNVNYGYTASITNCKPGEELWHEVVFPSCWDGMNLDTVDHKSHMAYFNARTGLCPSSHPVPLPEITFNIVYVVKPGDNLQKWRLSSDGYDHSRPGGFSSHGDWMYGWKQDIADAFVQFCNNASKDCHSHLLGDGRYID